MDRLGSYRQQTITKFPLLGNVSARFLLRQVVEISTREQYHVSFKTNTTECSCYPAKVTSSEPDQRRDTVVVIYTCAGRFIYCRLILATGQGLFRAVQKIITYLFSYLKTTNAMCSSTSYLEDRLWKT